MSNMNAYITSRSAWTPAHAVIARAINLHAQEVASFGLTNVASLETAIFEALENEMLINQDTMQFLMEQEEQK